MVRSKKLIAVILLGLVAVFALTACSESSKEAVEGNKAIANEREYSNGALSRILKNEPIPKLYHSSDVHNQEEFYTIQSDPNKIEYLTLLGMTGIPYAHFTIKGQVSSMNTQLTNGQQVWCTQWTTEHTGKTKEHETNDCGTVDQAEPNGIYQGQDSGHFAFTTAGALIEWDGPFIMSDQPIEIHNPVSLQLNENVAPTPTNLSGVQNGKLPNGRTE